MSKHNERYYEYNIASGNSADLKIGECDSEIRADVVVNEYRSIRLWGCVVNCNGYPVPNALVKLLKIVRYEHGYNYVSVAHTVTDCDGLYQFDILGEFDCDSYKVIVSKTAIASERIIDTKGGNCNPCDCKPMPKCEEKNPPKCDCYEKPPHVEPPCNKPCDDHMFKSCDCDCEEYVYHDKYTEDNYTVKKNTFR